MVRVVATFLLLVFLMVASILATTVIAGPPFLTDDPEPVPFKHYEVYLFSTIDATRKSTNGTGPAVNSMRRRFPTCKSI